MAFFYDHLSPLSGFAQYDRYLDNDLYMTIPDYSVPPIPEQSVPVIPEQSVPPFRGKVYHLGGAICINHFLGM